MLPENVNWLDNAAAIRHAAASKGLLSIRRDDIEDATVYGFCVGAGPHWFVLGILNDEYRPNGFQCMRFQDVSSIEYPPKRAKFIKRAIAYWNDATSDFPNINLQSTRSILETVEQYFELVTLHPEISDPDVCFVGVPESVNDIDVSLKTISPNAVWDDEPMELLLDDITRIDFGARYEEVLSALSCDTED